MAKFKITLKKDSVPKFDTSGNQVGETESEKKEVIITGKYCSEAVMQATRSSYGFYPVSWECIEADVKTPEELAEEAKNREIVEAWKKREEEKALKEEQEKEHNPKDNNFDGPDLYDSDAGDVET